jgi:tetratricopeptide (TPR) repeat protein/transcriptional regulator with XRE-family HTH domain
VVAEQLGLGFAELLRLLRAEARLTQEELAEAAELSPRSVSDLERGIHRTAQKVTAHLLADALGLPEPARALFVAAARGRGPVDPVLAAARDAAPGAAAAAATRTLPRDSANLTGRERELARLIEAVTPEPAGGVAVGVHVIDGMPGIGKTTLAVTAAHQLAGRFPDGQFFLPLHAHTPGQRPVDPADSLASLLETAGLAAQQIPPGLEARAARWRDHVAGKKILLLLDDAAGHEQVRPLLPGTAGSLVLITSRRRLAALDDAGQISLGTLSPPDAATLLVRLAGRPWLDSGDAGIGEITRLCGYLPLAIGMVASQLRNHPARTPAGAAAELAAARDRLTLIYAENLSVGAAFDLSYADLDPAQQRLFRRLGLVPGPGIDSYAAAALDGTSSADARRCLDELYDQHLLAEPAPGRYELHDLLREHARALAAADDPADRGAAVTRLLDYYTHAGLAAGEHFSKWETAHRRPPPGHPPADTPDLSTFGMASAWLDAERGNLHAAAAYAAGHGRSAHAIAISAAISSFLSTRGHWDQCVALQQSAIAAARSAGDRLGEADALVWLGGLQGDTGDYPAAADTLSQAMAIYDEAGDALGQSVAFGHIGFVQMLAGDYPAAEASHRRSLELARTADSRTGQAHALSSLGMVQQLIGDLAAAAASLQQALTWFTELGNRIGQAGSLNCLGVVQQEIGDYASALASQKQAVALSRDLGSVMFQAYALNDVGLVYQETGDYASAATCHQQALAWFGDLGYRIGQAEALNRLGEAVTLAGATGWARELHRQALAMAQDIHAAFEEARALEGLGRSYLHDGDPGQAAAHLAQAYTIYQRIGVPAAQRVRRTIQEHELTSAT